MLAVDALLISIYFLRTFVGQKYLDTKLQWSFVALTVVKRTPSLLLFLDNRTDIIINHG